MAFRGFGGYRAPSISRGGGAYSGPIFRQSRAALAGDIFSDFGQDFDYQPSYETSSPDFSDVTGGVSTVADPTFTTMGGLGDVATALGPYLGGVGKAIFSPTVRDLIGSPAAAGAAGTVAQAVAPHVKRALKRLVGGAGGGGARRRMNPGNFKALRRSMRRLASFEKAARHVIHFTHPKPTARVKFKFRRRRRR